VTRDSFLVFGAPVIGEDEIQAVVDTLRCGWIGTGPRVRKFEERFAEYIGVRHAVAVNSCTAALHLSLHALNIGPGDEVVTTPLTWCATANVIVHRGATPIFADVELETGNMDPNRIEDLITERTKAIMPVHYAGRPCDMDAILDIAKRKNLAVVGDAAHAVEAEWRGRKVGALGRTAGFSFYPNKNITTIEGGMLTTDDTAIAERAHMLSLHGVSSDAWRRFQADGPAHVSVEEAGYKYNMTDVQAALGLGQLAKVEAHLRRREEIWTKYDRALADSPLITPPKPKEGTRHARHLYTVLVDEKHARMDRDGLRAALKARNIGTGLHYIGLTLHPFYRERYGTRRGQCPNADYFSDHTLSLPLTAGMSDADVCDVIEALKEIV